jgi:hypothetical protein
MCVWLLVINCSKKAPLLFAIVCNSNFTQNTLALVQTLAYENILLRTHDIRESPDFIGILMKNQ